MRASLRLRRVAARLARPGSCRFARPDRHDHLHVLRVHRRGERLGGMFEVELGGDDLVDGTAPDGEQSIAAV